MVVVTEPLRSGLGASLITPEVSLPMLNVAREPISKEEEVCRTEAWTSSSRSVQSFLALSLLIEEVSEERLP